MSDERPFNYLERIANDIWLEAQSRVNADLVPVYPKEEAVMWLGYAVLCLAKGANTTSEDVHDAWTMWASINQPDHRSSIPFHRLTPEVQAYDDLYRDAIHAVWNGDNDS